MNIKEKIDLVMQEVRVDEELEGKIMKKIKGRKNMTNNNRWSRWSARKIVVAASLTLVLVGSVTVVASGLSNLWSEQVAKIFGVKEELQEKLVTDGYAHNLINENEEPSVQDVDEVLSTTCNGLTVTAVQTLADKYGMYIYLDVKSEEGLELRDQTFEGWDIWIDGKDQHYNNRNAGMVSDKYTVSRTERGYEIWMINNEEFDVSGKTIRIRLKDLMNYRTKLDEYTDVEGVWELQWQVKSSAESKHVRLNGIGDLEISPLSYRITYSKERGMSDTLDITFIMKDETIYKSLTEKEEEMITGGPGFSGSNGEVFGFSKVLDVDNLDKIVVDGKTYSVE